MRSPNDGGEWGILGGAFNPVHNGHLTLARGIRAAKRSDGVLLVPSYRPPRKSLADFASWDDRLAMLRLAVDDDPGLLVSTIESESETTGYTLLLVRALKKRYPEARLYFIIGADLLAEFDTWYEAGELINEIPVVAGSRPGAKLAATSPLLAGRVEIVETAMVDVSSRDIRARVKAGISLETLATLVPRPVAEYICKRKLYA